MDYLRRLKLLRQKMEMSRWDAFLITNPKDIFYFTGESLSEGKFLVTPHSATLIVDGRYFDACRKTGVHGVELAKESLVQHLPEGIATLAIDSGCASWQSYLDLAQAVKAITIKPAYQVIQKIRAIKEAEEIALLKEAAALGSLGFEYLVTQLQEGVEERELALQLEIFWRKRGASGVAFDPIIAFGENSALPHHRAGTAKLKKNDIVLIDIGVSYQGYNSDMTRVVFLGEVDPELHHIYSLVKEAKENAQAALKPHVPVDEIDAAARNTIASRGYGPQFKHNTGHGVGLDIHEWPRLRKKGTDPSPVLEEGMVVTIEPGIYLPGKGGVRIEDTVLITKTGYENLTHVHI